MGGGGEGGGGGRGFRVFPVTTLNRILRDMIRARIYAELMHYPAWRGNYPHE